MGLTYSLFLDFTLTTRTSPSPPGYTSVTRPSGQSPQLVSGSIIITSPFFWLCLGWNHLFHKLILGKNSLLHLFQNIFRSCCTRSNLFFGCKPISSSASGTSCPANWPARKWLGVSGDRSLWSELK